MATKKRSGGKVLDLTTRVLIEIRDEVRRTNERLETGFSAVNARLDRVDNRLEQVDVRLEQTNARLDQTIARLDNLRDLAGDRYRELDARVRALEARAS